MASELKNTNDENTYVNDPESGAEMLRLLDQDRTLTRCMGGMLAEQSGVEGLQDVLAIACGPGGWVLERALAYPQIEGTGIVISKPMIEDAHSKHRTRDLDND